MPTCTAQTPISYNRSARAGRRSGLTIVELMVAVLMVSLFVAFGQMNLSGFLRRHKFKFQAQELVSTMQKAISAASESNRRYSVIINVAEQSYTLSQITTPELYEEPTEEDIILTNHLNDNCRLAYIQFDDWSGTNDNIFRVYFVAGHSGWQYGGTIILLDEDDEPYSIIVNRMNRIITLKKGEIFPLEPRSKDEVSF